MKTFACILCALTLIGCATPGSRTDTEGVGPGQPYLAPNHGRVVKVNEAADYVILECAVLPKPGDRITLWRGNKGVGVVLVNRIMSGRHAAADIEEGFPMAGDRFRSDRQGTFNNEIRP